MPENKCTPRDKMCSNRRVDAEQTQRWAWQGGVPGSLTAAWARPCPGRAAHPNARASPNAHWGQRCQLKWFFWKNTRACLHSDLSHTPSLFYLTQQKIITVICTDVLLVPLPLSTVRGPSPRAQALDLGALQGAVFPGGGHLPRTHLLPPALTACCRSPVLCLQGAPAERCSMWCLLKKPLRKSC